ncbi:MAG: phosphatase PAP2 family protein [Bacteriovoracaceae bacterium]|nr:phosphatase PAP2 family protein [Bacteriovoracaceae bacterium]
MKKSFLYFCIFPLAGLISFAPKAFSQEELFVIPLLENFLHKSDKENSIWKNQAAEYEEMRSFRNNDSPSNCLIYLGTSGAITAGKWDQIFPKHQDALTPNFLKALKLNSKKIERQSQLAKEYFKRLRPYKNQNIAPGLAYTPCSDEVFTSAMLNSSKFYSFPSTHSVQARVAALFLAMSVSKAQTLETPEKFLKENYSLIAHGSLMALHRVLAGHHYPTDILAGEAVADSLFCKTFEAELSSKLTTNECEEILTYVHQFGGLRANGRKEKWAVTFF